MNKSIPKKKEMKIPNIKLSSKRVLAVLEIEKVTKGGIILPGRDKKDNIEEAKLNIIMLAEDYEGDLKVGDKVGVSPTSCVFLPIEGEEYISFYDNAVYFKYL